MELKKTKRIVDGPFISHQKQDFIRSMTKREIFIIEATIEIHNFRNSKEFIFDNSK